MADQLVLRIKTKQQGNIKGESAKEKHEGQIDLEHFEFGVTRPQDMARGGSSSATGAAQYQLAHFTKRGDVSSPNLLRAIGVNDAIEEAVVTFLVDAGGGKIYQTVKFKNAMVASWSMNCHHSAEAAESFSLTYSSVELIHHKQTTEDAELEGQNRVELDVKSNKEI